MNTVFKKTNKIIAFLRSFWGFCPQCNSDAPEIDNCLVCDNDRTSPFGIKKRKKYWTKYLEL